MTETGIVTVTAIAPLLLILTGLAFTVVIDSYILRAERRVMLIIVVLCLTLIAQNLADDILFAGRSHLGWKNALSAYGYSVRPVLLILFLYIVDPGGKKWPEWTLAGINAVLYCTSPMTKLCFDIRGGDFVMLRGPLWLACPVVSAVLLAELLLRSVLRYRERGWKEHFIPVAVALSIIVSVALDMSVGVKRQPVTFLTVAIVTGSVFYYIWLHLQFVREHERDLMAAGRIRIMMTQIQPHFLFNALNTVRALYAKDPPLADKTLEDFSTYLRQNLESLSRTELIPVTREIEHTRIYSDIETLRFPDVRVEYRIEDEAFTVPALSIQPLVENAIRHGVRGRADGRVTVSAAYDAAMGVHRITVEDNGAGFDPEKQKSDEGSHIGLANVKERVERMCGGSMILHSEIGKGTAVTLLIPDASKNGGKRRKT